MKRVTIQEARKLFEKGIVIYILPSRIEYVPGIKISVFVSKSQYKDFNGFVDSYRMLSGSKLRYYVYENEIEKLEKSKKISDALKYSKHELMRIGSNVASLWGAECYDYKVDTKSKKVLFSCIEHGEEFATELGFDELEKYLY